MSTDRHEHAPGDSSTQAHIQAHPQKGTKMQVHTEHTHTDKIPKYREKKIVHYSWANKWMTI